MVIVAMAICGMTFTAAALTALAAFKLPKGRRLKYGMGALGLGTLAAVLFVWSLSFVGPS